MIDLHVGEDGEVRLTLCGVDIRKLVRGACFELKQDSGRLKLRVELDLLIFRDARLGGDAIIGITPEMEELLKSFGWTPPAEPGSEEKREKPE